MREETLEFQKLREAVISAQMQTGAKLAAEWVYNDEDGFEAFRVLELESEDDHRRHVRMVWPEFDGPRWFMGEPKQPWPLYGVSELPVGQRVYVCQNESAVRQARKAGLAAVAVAHGANGVHKTSFAPLAGCDVVILLLAIVMTSGLGREHAGLAKPAALGGRALMSAARASWLAVPDAADPDRRLLLPAKNILTGQASGLAYRIVNGAVAWERGAVEVPAGGMAKPKRQGRKLRTPAGKRDEAARWLLARLSAGPAYVGSPTDTDQAGSLVGELSAAGFSDMTLRRAFVSVGAVSERCPSTGRYRWRLSSEKESAAKRSVHERSGGNG
jgi:hypothetical protein